jgi:hypothetical protein
MGLKGADAGILALAPGISRRERIQVQFLSADQEQILAARPLARRDRFRVVPLPVGLKQSCPNSPLEPLFSQDLPFKGCPAGIAPQ